MFEPLASLRILDLTRLVPGAAVSHYFADLGADVIKVEDTGVGDYIREVRPLIEGVGLQHLTLDRNKRSIALDLADESGFAVFAELVRGADAVAENSRPGTMARRGAGYAELRELNERLVYLSFSGYGQDSPYAHLPSHGSNLAAFAGINPIVRREDGVVVHGPMPYGRYRISMEQAALYPAFALLAAIHEARRRGSGRHLDISLVHALMAGDYAAMTDQLNNGQLYWQELPQPTPRYGYYEASDGEVLLVCALEKRFWQSFCELIERPDLSERGDWEGQQMDFGVADVELYREVQRTIAERSREDWLGLLLPAGIPCSPVNSLADACRDPGLGGRLFTDRAVLESGREVELMGPPAQDPPRSFRSRPAPSPGRDTEEVLDDFGVDPQVVEAARAAGALR